MIHWRGRENSHNRAEARFQCMQQTNTEEPDTQGERGLISEVCPSGPACWEEQNRPRGHTWGLVKISCAPPTSLVAQMVKNLPAKQETQVRSPGREDSLEKGMATHSSILAWRIPRTEEPGWATVHGVKQSNNWVTNTLHACIHLRYWCPPSSRC